VGEHQYAPGQGDRTASGGQFCAINSTRAVDESTKMLVFLYRLYQRHSHIKSSKMVSSLRHLHLNKKTPALIALQKKHRALSTADQLSARSNAHSHTHTSTRSQKQKWHDETKRSLEREILAAQVCLCAHVHARIWCGVGRVQCRLIESYTKLDEMRYVF
jgi:hypothetical protein